MVIDARADNHCFGLLSALRAHTKVPHKTDSLWKGLRPLNRPGWAGPDRERALHPRREHLAADVASHCHAPLYISMENH
jgi:hypothetical protein